MRRPWPLARPTGEPPGAPACPARSDRAKARSGASSRPGARRPAPRRQRPGPSCPCATPPGRSPALRPGSLATRPRTQARRRRARAPRRLGETATRTRTRIGPAPRTSRGPRAVEPPARRRASRARRVGAGCEGRCPRASRARPRAPARHATAGARPGQRAPAATSCPRRRRRSRRRGRPGRASR